MDDEVRSLCLLESVLDRLRFKHLRKLTDPTRILEEFEAFQPDLIITDIEMPEMDGIQLVEQIRNYLPREACLPILVLTGAQDPQIKRRALIAGATDILFKPFDSSEMQMRVRSLLQTRMQYLEIEAQNRVLEQKVTERTVELQKALTELQTNQRQMVQQERFRAFGEMAGGVCHDFNNALMAIIGYTELLLQNAELIDDRELLREYLKTMNIAGRDASHVVSRLRDFYRPREENDVFTAVDVNDLIEEIVPLTKPKWHGQALESGRTIRVDLELQKLPPVLGNSSELRETLMNLVFNAVDAMPKGGTITLRTVPLEDAIRIEVADTGTGMTEEVRQRCLEPFFSTKGDDGTGLGLAMSFGIVRRHEGTMDIETVLGEGTTFVITLPCNHAPIVEEEEACHALDRTLRVLVVDDEPNTREVVSGYLRGDGHRVMTASNGNDAVRHFMSEDFDIVITDHGMPGMNGLQLAEIVHRINPAKSVILLTGFAFGPEQQPTTIDCVLKKPLIREELRAALRNVMEDRHTSDLTLLPVA
ncbi:response regulator [Chthoniobacter flavus]|uniref:response regulator n=1 Tax=Chthoniobacter flavus TaxID=191863 RepID=UPI0002DDCA8E|nr:response regulator [Chthoniobacter flavus]